MRRAAVLLALLLPGCSAGGAAPVGRTAQPARVMSLNQCTDQLVLVLLPPERIASVTWLSRDPRYSLMVAAAARVAANRGALEEVVREQPDLIVTDTFSAPEARAMLHRLGYPMLELSDASDVATIRSNVRSLAAALGERARGEALIAAMDGDLAAAWRGASPLRVAPWSRDGTGGTPLQDVVLNAAGARDVANGSGGVEELLVADPEALVVGGTEPDPGDGAAASALVARRWPRERRIVLPPAETICGTPLIGRAALSVRRQVDRIVGSRA